MHCLLTIHQELNGISKKNFLRAYNNIFILELYLFSCRLDVFCFVARLGFYLGCCTICSCYRSVGRKCITVSS